MSNKQHTFTSLATALLRSGIRPSHTSELNRCIWRTNALAVVIGCLSIPCIIALLAAGPNRLIIGALPILLFHFSLPLFNKWGFFNCSRMALVVVGSGAIVGFSMVLDAAAGIHHLLVLYTTFPLIFFLVSESRLRSFAGVVVIASVLLVVGRLEQNLFHTVLFLITVLLVACVVFFFYYSNSRAEYHLKYLTSAIEQSIDGIMIAGLDGTVRFVNKSWAHMHGYEPAELKGENIRVFYTDEQLENEFKAFNANVFKTHANEGEINHVKKDGSVFPTWMSVTLLKKADGTPMSMLSVARNISERKRIQSQMEEMNLRLVQTAHEAGKAELATDVLHNVGNVLNSVNVTSELLRQKLSKSAITTLPNVAKLIEGHRDNLEDFFKHHEKGKLLPRYFKKLSETTESERATVWEYVTSIIKHIDHIKSIVSMQQSYAKMAGVIEPTSLEETIDNALKLNETSMSRKTVAIDVDVGPVPLVRTDKQKVMEILVNLFNNAKQAVLDNPAGDNRIDIRLYAVDASHARIEVKDDGVGISKANLTKIFTHGFTTKKDGHGFGLHSSANAAHQLGGSLMASSDGEGKGATFVLELPINGTASTPTDAPHLTQSQSEEIAGMSQRQ
ncbi:MAG: PAS domain S-box protein [Myxococcota bacterium]|nr:PAS domain S-box protein [Myxococcota bacterium]